MPKRRLAVDLAGAMAVKLAALVLIYFLFFASPPKIDAALHVAPDLPAASNMR